MTDIIIPPFNYILVGLIVNDILKVFGIWNLDTIKSRNCKHRRISATNKNNNRQPMIHNTTKIGYQVTIGNALFMTDAWLSCDDWHDT